MIFVAGVVVDICALQQSRWQWWHATGLKMLTGLAMPHKSRVKPV